MAEPRLVLVAGTPGCGKSTLLRSLSERMAADHATLCYGDVLAEIREVKDPIHKDDIPRHLVHHAELGRYDLLIMERVLRELEQRHVFFEFHASALTPYGYVPFGQDQLRLLRATAILLVEAPASLAVRWTAADNANKGRRRAPFSEAEMTMFQDLNRNFACAYSVALGIPLKLVLNRDGEIDLLAGELLGWLERLGLTSS